MASSGLVIVMEKSCPGDLKCLAPYSRYIPVHHIATQTSVITSFLVHKAALGVTERVTYVSLEHLPPRGGLTADVTGMVTASA